MKREYSIEGVSLLEEICIPLKEEEAIPYLEAIGNTNIKWRGQIRAGVSEGVLKLARDSGCLEISFGVESASQRVVDIANKRIKLDTVKETIRHCKENGIKVQIYLLNGLPGEPPNIVQLTKAFIDETQPDLVIVSSLCPYPGSPIFNNHEYYGIKWIDHDYEKYNHLVCRFRDSQDNPQDLLPFEYHAKTRWGKALSRKQILDNLFELQDFLIERGLNK